MKTILKLLGVVLTLTIVLGAAVQADVVTYTDTQNVPPADPSYPYPVGFSIVQFNPAFGTLNSVTLTVSGTASSALSFTNFDGVNGGVALQNSNCFWIGYVSAIDTSNNVVQDDFVWQTTHYNLTGLNHYERPGTSNVYNQSWGPEYVPLTTTNFTLSADLANFTGTMNVPVFAQFDDVFNMVTTGGNNKWSLSTSGSATAQVTYDFTPVPEPSTFGLIGFAFGGLVLLLPRRKP